MFSLRPFSSFKIVPRHLPLSPKTSSKIVPRFPFLQQIRSLHLHEYQSQGLMKDSGINVPTSSVASTEEEAFNIARALDTQDFVVKAQILAGGRGLGLFDNGFKGGVHICNSVKQVRDLASKMLGHRLITKQTGPEGKPVSKVLIGRRYFVRRETYFAIVLDRAFNGPVLVGSSKGGVDIESVAKETPELIVKEPIDLLTGVQPHQTERIARELGFSESKIPLVQQQIEKMYNFFLKKDCTLLEINPFVETNEGEVLCMDAKLNIDDNASFRQKELFDQEDKTQQDLKEVIASKYDLNFIALDGDIGCLVNGAGLAMATMDIIKLNGGLPANFLDVGGGATKQQVTEAIKLLSSDKNVKSILINIFGGIMKCDIIALGLISAAKELHLKIPLIVRLQGTNVHEAKQIMADSGLRILSADDLDDAAQKAVKSSAIVKIAEAAHLSVSFELPL